VVPNLKHPQPPTSSHCGRPSLVRGTHPKTSLSTHLVSYYFNSHTKFNLNAVLIHIKLLFMYAYIDLFSTFVIHNNLKLDFCPLSIYFYKLIKLLTPLNHNIPCSKHFSYERYLTCTSFKDLRI